MGDFTATENALRARLAEFTGLPIVQPNADAEPTLADYPNGFVVADFELSGEAPISIGVDGERWHRDTGVFSVHVLVPRGSLVGALGGHTQSIRNLFKVNAVSGVVVTNRVIGRQRISGPDSRFYGCTVSVSFFADRQE